MNRKARLNYIRAISQQVNRKKMYKAKKQWVVAGMTFLVATGLSAISNTLTTHADTTNNNINTTQKIPSSQNKARVDMNNVVQAKATQLHSKIMSGSQQQNKAKVTTNQTNQKPSQNSSVSNGVAKQDKVQNPSQNENKVNQTDSNNDKATNNNVQNNRKGIQTTGKNLQAVQPKQVNAGDDNSHQYSINKSTNNIKNRKISMPNISANSVKVNQSSSINGNVNRNSNNNIDVNKNSDKLTAIEPKIKVGESIPNYFTGATHNGTDCGMNYTAYANGGVEFTGGTANNELLELFTGDNTVSLAIAIKFDSDVDISKVTNMVNMFGDDKSLQTLILPSSFDTSKVTDMSWMFKSDSDLQTLTLPSSFDTSNVTDMSKMFLSDLDLQTLTLPSSFDTSKVTNMSDMFGDEMLLKSLTLPSSFDTSNVTDMSDMFIGNSLKSLTLPSSFNTSKVTNMNDMFAVDTALQTLTLPSSFDTSKVTNMSDMFESDSSLHSITINSSKTKFNNSVSAPSWFKNAYQKDDDDNYTSATPVNLLDGQPHVGTFVAKCNPNVVTNTVDINYSDGNGSKGNFSTQVSGIPGTKVSIKDAIKSHLPNNYIQNGDIKINGVSDSSDEVTIQKGFVCTPQPAGTVDKSSDPSHYHVYFNSDTKTATLTGNFSHVNLYLLPSILYSTNVKELNLGNAEFSPNTDSSFMFAMMPNLIRVKSVGNFDTSNITNMNGMFEQDNSLTDISGVSDWNTSNVTNMNLMFTADNSLSNLSALSNWNTSNVTNMSGMFQNDSGIMNLGIVNNWNTTKVAPFSIIANSNNFIDKSDSQIGITQNNQTVGINGKSEPIVGKWHIDNLGEVYIPKQAGLNYKKYANIPAGQHFKPVIPIAKPIQVSVPIKLNQVIDTINYMSGNTKVGSDSFKGTDSTSFAVTKDNDKGLPKGYHLVNPNNPFTYDGATHTILVARNKITGSTTLHLVYKESNGAVDSRKDINIPINATTSDNNISVDPFDYIKDNYSIPNTEFTIPINASIAPYSDNTNYHPSSDTFTYTATTANNLVVKFTDDVKDTVHYGQTVGTQAISDPNNSNIPWIVGNTIKLGVSGANDGQDVLDVLKAPKGFSLSNNITPIQLRLTRGAMVSKPMVLTVSLGSTAKNKPAIKPKNNHKPIKVNKVTKHSFTPNHVEQPVINSNHSHKSNTNTNSTSDINALMNVINFMNNNKTSKSNNKNKAIKISPKTNKTNRINSLEELVSNHSGMYHGVKVTRIHIRPSYLKLSHRLMVYSYSHNRRHIIHLRRNQRIHILRRYVIGGKHKLIVDKIRVGHHYYYIRKPTYHKSNKIRRYVKLVSRLFK